MCRSVGFAYEDGPPVLRDIDLRVDDGEFIGIVGGSGAGKTTLVDLILGLLDPSQGEIIVGGHPLRQVRSQWQRSVGYVSQHITLIDETVEANVAFGVDRTDVEPSRVEAALRAAELFDFVAALPLGLDSMVGENGVRFSGGERQRLGIARALYHGPRVLLFDEATSALDNHTEARIVETIEACMGR